MGINTNTTKLDDLYQHLEVTLALYHWGLYQLLGKLSSTLYLWRKVS